MKKTLLLSSFLLISFVLTGCWNKPTTTNTTTQPTSNNPQTASLASCLNDKGFAMYGTERCPHCKAQKELFGADWSKVTYVDCDKEAEKCKTAQITGYPTWKGTDGKAYPGTQQLDMLSQYAGCKM